MSPPAITAEQLEFWRSVPVAIIVDIDPAACQIDPNIRSLRTPNHKPRLFGTAVTAQCNPPDFGPVLRAADEIASGDVLVISARGHRETAMIGEIVSGCVQRLGGNGVICDGAVRDAEELITMKDFEVFSRHITPRGPASAIGDAINVPVRFGGLVIEAGDLIIGDSDGLARLTPAMAKSFMEAATAKMTLENEWKARLGAGETIKDVLLHG